MLELKNISKTFNAGTVNQKVALNGLNLTMNEGDFVTVIGGNGAGKSTMLNAIAGVFQVDTGKILIDGVDVTALPEYKRAKYIGRVFQDPMMGLPRLCRSRKTLRWRHAGASPEPSGPVSPRRTGSSIRNSCGFLIWDWKTG